MVSAADEIAGDMDPGLLSAGDARMLERCSSRELGEYDLNVSVSDMCRMLERVHGRRAIILVDEYDRAFQGLPSEDGYEEVVGRLRPFMEQTFKTNYSMCTGVITGIMPLMKAKMLSGFNNPVVCDIFSSKGDELFGFTEQEVEGLLRDSIRIAEVKTKNPGMRL